MCNKIHRDKVHKPRKIKPNGRGYKLIDFIVGHNKPIATYRATPYSISPDGWIKNTFKSNSQFEGFTFFTTKQPGRDVLATIHPALTQQTRLYRIEYRGAEVSFISTETTGFPVRFSICSEFKLLYVEDVKRYPNI